MLKNCLLAVVVLFLIFSKLCWGDGSSQTGNFSQYVNSPEGSVWGPVNKNINPIYVIKENSVKADSVQEDSQPGWQGISTHWQACSITSDCTAVVVDCASWEALNKKYLNRIAKSMNSCSASIDPGFQPETVCVNKACKITDKTTHVSWQEWLSQMRKTRESLEKGKI